MFQRLSILIFFSIIIFSPWSVTASSDSTDYSHNTHSPIYLAGVGDFFNNFKKDLGKAVEDVSNAVHGNAEKKENEIKADEDTSQVQSRTVISSPSNLTREEHRQIQQYLIDSGYNPGPADGYPGVKTTAAIKQYQSDYGLAIDGKPSRQLLNKLSGQRVVRKNTTTKNTTVDSYKSSNKDSISASANKIGNQGCVPLTGRFTSGRNKNNQLSIYAVAKSGEVFSIGKDGATIIPSYSNIVSISNRLWGSRSLIATVNTDSLAYVGNNLLVERESKINTYPFKGAVNAVPIADGEAMVLKNDCSLWRVSNNRDPLQIFQSGTVRDISSNTIVGINGEFWPLNRHLKLNSKTSKKNPAKILSKNTIKLAKGSRHSLELRADGSVWGRGVNRHGQLGDGTDLDRTEMVKVKVLSDIVDIYIPPGRNMSMALQNNGTLWAWGDNSNGQLGTKSNAAAIAIPEKVKLARSNIALNLNKVDADKLVASAKKAECESIKLSLIKNKGALDSQDLSCIKSLRGVDLSQARFTGVNMSGVDFSGADLSGASFWGSNLSNTNLTDANLDNANFYQTNMRNSILDGASLKNATLDGVDLSGSSLKNSNLMIASFLNVDINGVDFTGSQDAMDTVMRGTVKNQDQAKGLSVVRGNNNSTGQQVSLKKSDGTQAAYALILHLSGKSVSYKTPAMHGNPAMDISVFICGNGEFLFKDNLAGGKGNIGGGSALRAGKWTVYSQSGKAFIQLMFNDGDSANYEAMIQGGNVYIDGDIVSVSNNNPLCN